MLRRSVGWFVPLLAAMTFSPAAGAGNPLVQAPSDFASSPAHGYAVMQAEACYQMLDDRGIAYERASAGPLVDAPVHLTGPLHGVTFKHVHPRTSGTVLDCRLLLALDDFAMLLRDHDVHEVGYVAAYRPDRSGKSKPGQRHPAGLAMDIAWFAREDGQRLVVEKDYAGHVGSKTCGRGAQKPAADNDHGAALRRIVCDTGKARLFHLFLTPNYDRDHRDHVHVEVRRNIHWFLVQ